MAIFHSHCLVVVLILCCFSSSYQQPCNRQDRASLLAFSASISISSSPLLNWSSSVTCCMWEGVDCDVNGRVIGLQLPSRGLVGQISSSIENLVSLTRLNLSNNFLSGSLPAGLFGSLKNLEFVDLSFNRLTGNFSSSLSSKGSLPTNISTLRISNNQFDGVIESTLFTGASSLSSFNVSNNSFSGLVPSSICTSCPLLKALDFSDNSFSGLIPSSIGNCSILQVFRAGFNSFSGSIPNSIYGLRALTEISLSTTHLSGYIRKEIGHLTNLRVIELSSNSFSGYIPWEIGNLSKMEELNLDNNNLSGSVPPSLMNCTNLINLTFRRNKLVGAISTLNFSKLVSLRKLDLSRNGFTGTLPESLYSCKAVVALRVASNNLTGQISPKIVEMNSLSFISLTNNSFQNIPSTLRILAACKNLTILFLGYNFYNETLPSARSFIGSNGFPNLQYLSLLSCNLSGYFPEWISNMKSLRILNLSYNKFTGTIPNWLRTLPNLFSLELSDNYFLGGFPHELCFLPALVSADGLSKLNHFYFELPVFGLFPGRHTWDQFIVFPPIISLENNRISGTIPSEIGNLQNLNMLYLNGNNLSGGIPSQISHLKNLEQLSLAQNHLTGEIPASLGKLNFLSKFDVSHNDLQGRIPTGGQFDTFPASSFEGNPGLCGVVLQRTCNTAPKKQRQAVDDTSLFADGFAVGFASGFSGIIALVVSYIWYKTLYMIQPEQEEAVLFDLHGS